MIKPSCGTVALYGLFIDLFFLLPLVNSLSLNQSETVFKIKFEALHFELMIPKHQQITV
jgi:hypothetical protein